MSGLDAIARSKRILALVDAYHEDPNSDTRYALRLALMDAFAPIRFPTMLRKMWSADQVQRWLNENVNDKASAEPIGWRYRGGGPIPVQPDDHWQVSWGVKKPYIAWTHQEVEPIYGSAS